MEIALISYDLPEDAKDSVADDNSLGLLLLVYAPLNILQCSCCILIINQCRRWSSSRGPSPRLNLYILINSVCFDALLVVFVFPTVFVGVDRGVVFVVVFDRYVYLRFRISWSWSIFILFSFCHLRRVVQNLFLSKSAAPFVCAPN